MAPFFSSYGVFFTNEKKKVVFTRVGRGEIPSRSEDEVQSVSCGCGAPCDDSMTSRPISMCTVGVRVSVSSEKKERTTN